MSEMPNDGDELRSSRPAEPDPNDQVLPLVESREALLAHARALDGLRDAQLELGRRLEGSRAMGERVERLQGQVERLREQQQGLETALRGARRSGRLLVGTLLLIVLAAVVVSLYGPQDWRRALLGRLQLGEGQAASAADAQRSVADDGVRGQDVSPPTPTDLREIDPGRDLVLGAEASVPATSTGGAAPTAGDDVLSSRLDASVRERNEQFAELVRLRSELFEANSRLSDVMSTIDAVAAVQDPEPARISRTAERTPDPFVTSLNDALVAAGVRTVRILEGRLEGGAVVDALLADVDLMGNVRGARVYERLALEVEKGAVRLRMRRAPTDERPGGDELTNLSRWDESAWLVTGLAVPRGFVPLDEVHDAVVALLTGQAYGLRSLGGYEAGLLLDVEIDEFDLQGKLVRTLVAARGRVDRDGPTLVLEDGVSVQDGVERELYKGRARLPLPGASLTTVPMLAGALP